MAYGSDGFSMQLFCAECHDCCGDVGHTYGNDWLCNSCYERHIAAQTEEEAENAEYTLEDAAYLAECESLGRTIQAGE